MGDINKHSNSLLRRLQKKFPYARGVYEVEKGLLQAEFICQDDVPLGGLIVQTTEENDIWLRIHPGYSAYPVDNVEELLQLMQEIFKDEVLWAIGFQQDQWVETTLIRNRNELELAPGIVYHLYSWSGNLDETVMTK